MASKEYRGRLSTACEPCRARRIKCDEERPSCARCIKSGVRKQCRYRNLTEIMFRDENSDTAERAKNTWRTRTKRSSLKDDRNEVITPGCDFTDLGLMSRRSDMSSPMNGLKCDVMEHAVNRFFYDYMLPSAWSEKFITGNLDYVPSVLEKTSKTSGLYEAIYAVSLANFERRNWFLSGGFRPILERHYGNALRLVAKDTKDPILASSDQLLLAVQILGIFEQMSTGGNNPVSMQAHANGMAALLSLRHIPVVDGHYTWRMCFSINVQLLTISLRLEKPSFISYSRLQHLYEDSQYPVLSLIGLVHRGVDLLALWKATSASINSKDSSQISSAQNLAQQASLLEKMLALNITFDVWEANAPLGIKFDTCPTPASSMHPKWLQPLLNHPGAPRFSHKYDSISLLYAWSLWRMVRVRISTVLLRNTNSTHAESTLFRATIERMIIDTCRSVVPAFSTPIQTKPPTDCVYEVCGFRPYVALLPLNIAKVALQATSLTPAAQDTLSWIDEIRNFTMHHFHRNIPVAFMTSEWVH